MSPNDVAGVARDTVSALKASPALLVIILLNLGMLGTIIYIGQAQREERQLLTRNLVENCRGLNP